MQVSGAGGEPRPYLDLPDGERGHSHPELLPGGGGVLFGVAGRAAVGGVDAYSGLSGAQIAVHEHETGERRVLVEGSSPRFLPTGHLTFARSGALWAVPFDSDRLELNGEPVPVLDDLLVSSAGGAVTALANDGSLVYAPASQAETSLFWVDRNGREEPLGLPSGNYSLASISPDGMHLV